LLKKPARLGLARRIGQGRSNTADKARIILANIDLDPHETPALHARAVRRKRGFCLGHSHASEFPENVPEIARGRKGDCNCVANEGLACDAITCFSAEAGGGGLHDLETKMLLHRCKIAVIVQQRVAMFDAKGADENVGCFPDRDA
jgi:hypothetical protein